MRNTTLESKRCSTPDKKRGFSISKIINVPLKEKGSNQKPLMKKEAYVFQK
jgi:hypothetical protein